MIKKFHEKLQEIIKNVNHMGKLVQEAVEGATASLKRIILKLHKRLLMEMTESMILK